MTRTAIRIESIPYTIKIRVKQYLYQKIYIVGYKKISNKYKTPVIEFTNGKRIWMLKHEIALKYIS
uniref:Cytochrome b6-f complex subunit PetP n=1 Tax=Chondria sp. (in: red algae) TaxID=1982705 RepID=A0A1Z1MDS2_9FLOR|nr:cytochrome b6-f complex subunit PetP [Chondria sp. (in: red algae)]